MRVIETAADVVENDILKVPGFGPALTSRLLAWRRTLEKQFRFDVASGVDPADIATLNRDLDARKALLEGTLSRGTGQLQEIRRQTLDTRESLKPELQKARFVQALAEADMEVGWR